MKLYFTYFTTSTSYMIKAKLRISKNILQNCKISLFVQKQDYNKRILVIIDSKKLGIKVSLKKDQTY